MMARSRSSWITAVVLLLMVWCIGAGFPRPAQAVEAPWQLQAVVPQQAGQDREGIVVTLKQIRTVDLRDESDIRAARQLRLSEIDGTRLAITQQQLTDADGTVTFHQLEAGVYLIEGTDASAAEAVNPAVIMVPTEHDGQWSHLKVILKPSPQPPVFPQLPPMPRVPTSAQTPPPTTVPNPTVFPSPTPPRPAQQLAQTGASVLTLTLIALALVAAGTMLSRRKKDI